MTTIVIVNECTAAPPGSVGVRWWNAATGTALSWNFSYERYASFLPRQLSTVEQDWIEVFGALYAVDRVAIRPPLRWSRSIEAHIPVRHPDLWQPLAEALRDVWSRLTGDRLQLEFHRAVQPMPPPRTSAPAPPAGVEGTALFSGGLDSFAAVAQLESQGIKPALLTHVANAAVQNSVKSLLRALPGVPRPTPLPITAKNGNNSGIATDESQRARSLLYVASAVLASKTFGVDTVWVGENGILSVHEPETEARVPSLSTRTAHPQVLEAVASLSASAMNFSPVVLNPLEGLTKAGIIQLIDSLGHAVKVEDAVSCWKITRTPKHCGYCIPCLQRFVGSSTAGVADNVYGHNPWLAASAGPGSHDDEQDNLVHFIQLAQRIDGATDHQIEFEHPGLIGIGGALTDGERLDLHRLWAAEVLTVAAANPRSSAIL